MPDNSSIVREKLDQAVAILNELGIDVWLTFVRETSLTPDPSLDLILDLDMVWQSAFLITRDNQRIAILGQHDADNVQALGGYTRIVPYLEGIRTSLIDTLMTLDSGKIALNYSENDPAADGLGHGMMMLLQRYLGDTSLLEHCVSAEQVIGTLRGRKSPGEVERIKAAVDATQVIFNQTGAFIQPGRSEIEIASEVLRLVDEAGIETSWERSDCPIVNAGPDSSLGHAGPQPDLFVRRGQLVHLDFGVRQDDYCSDLQRSWYVRQGIEDIPADIQRAFAAARSALMAGFNALQPGAEGWQVDAAARSALVEAGYPEYMHAFGHHVGRATHDGSTILGPLWERYGHTPHGVIEPGNVFAIELDVSLPDYGHLGLEENVLVTTEGAVWLSDPQTEVWIAG